jgi:hypothetical protein
MRRLRALLLRLRETLFSRADDFAAEVESHLQLHIDDNLRAGMTLDEARRNAVLRLGGMAQTRERYRDRHGIPALDALQQDLVYAVRALRKTPGFAATAIVTLALGIGANSAIFSLVNATLLRPLPFKNPDRLVMIYATDTRRGNRFDGATYPDFADWRNQNQMFESMAAYADQSVTLSVRDQTVLIEGKRVTPNLFEVLGVQPSLGRAFRVDEQEPGATGVVVLSDGFWKRHLPVRRTSSAGSCASTTSRTPWSASCRRHFRSVNANTSSSTRRSPPIPAAVTISWAWSAACVRERHCGRPPPTSQRSPIGSRVCIRERTRSPERI